MKPYNDRHLSLRWVLTPEVRGLGVFYLKEDKAKHLRKVLRIEWGQALCVTNGCGITYRGRLIKQGDGAAIELDEIIRDESSNEPNKTVLIIGLPKNSTMDWVIEKATECGVSEIIPVVFSRSVVKPGEKKYNDRWQRISDEALEQSEGLWRVKIHSPVNYHDWVSQNLSLEKYSKFACLSELRSSEEMSSLGRTLKLLRNVKAKPIAVVIGPEGGFSNQEVEDLRSHGYEALGLGNTVFRVETAVVFALGLVKTARESFND